MGRQRRKRLLVQNSNQIESMVPPISAAWLCNLWTFKDFCFIFPCVNQSLILPLLILTFFIKSKKLLFGLQSMTRSSIFLYSSVSSSPINSHSISTLSSSSNKQTKPPPPPPPTKINKKKYQWFSFSFLGSNQNPLFQTHRRKTLIPWWTDRIFSSG